MIFIRQIVQIESKICGLRNMSHLPTYMFGCQSLVHYPKYDMPPSNSLEDFKQNHWTTKYSLLTYIFYDVNLCVTLINYHKYDIPPSNSLEDIKQSHWTMKNRSLTYKYFMRSIFVSHNSIIPSITFPHQIV